MRSQSAAGIAPRQLTARIRIVVVEQLSRLLRAGVPLVQALDEISASASDRRLKEAVREIREAVNRGDTLGDAVKRAGVLFGPSEWGLVEAGEKTGRLGEVLERIAARWKRGMTFRRRLAVGAVYPTLLLLASVLIMPVPKLFFGGIGPYLADVGLSLLWIAMVVFVVVAAFVTIRIKGWEKTLKRFAWWLPGFRSIYRRRVRSDLYHALSIAFSAGLGVYESLEIAGTAVADPTAADACREASARIDRGERLTDALTATGILPQSALVALAGAERSGTLEESLFRLSEDSDRDLDQAMKVLLAIANVLILLVVVGMVAARILGSAFSVLPGGGGSFDELERELLKESPFIRVN